MTQKLPWTPWHRIVKLRDDVRTGELSLADFAADLHDVIMQRGTRPIYEDPARFFALTYPTFALRELAKDVVLRLAGRNTKAVRQLELTYGGGKTHTLVTLRHLAHDPDTLPDLPAVEQFKSHARTPLTPARVAALAFDKLDVEKGMEVRGPHNELRWLKHPWSVLAFQIAGAAGIRALHAEGLDEERETPPAEPLLVDLIRRPQAEGLATLVLIDEVLMFARGKTAMDPTWGGRLTDFFQYLCQAATKVDRCALVASLLASDLEKNDESGKAIGSKIAAVFNRQREEGVQPVQQEDVAEVLRRRFFTPESITDGDVFRPHVTTAVGNIVSMDDTVRGNRENVEKRFQLSYPFHPGLTDLFYTRWTQLDRFQRTRGILRTFAIALRDAEPWDTAPLVGPNVFLAAPEQQSIAEAARELTGIATGEATESHGHDWTAILEGELAKARTIQDQHPGLQNREMEQAVCTVFLGSQPIGQKTHTPDLFELVGTTRPDRIELEQGLRRWTELSWFLDENEFGSRSTTDGGLPPLPREWRLGNRPNLKQMHHDACTNRVTADMVEHKLLTEVRGTKSLIKDAKASGARVHMLPKQPGDIEDDTNFHFAILGPEAVCSAGRASTKARRFIEEKAGSNHPRIHRNGIMLVAPSTSGIEGARIRIREYLGWEDVQNQLKVGEQPQDPVREEMLATWTKESRLQIPEAIRQAWTIVVTVNSDNRVHAFRVTVASDPLFATIKADRRARIQETAINAEALMPDGPYELWRDDESSRRVKDLASAFAEQPRLPKMLQADEIVATINRGVEDGLFVASLPRPDGTAKTWWRTPIDERKRSEPALEVFLPNRTTVSDLDPAVLTPGVLPELWKDNSITVTSAIDYFAAGRTVIASRDGCEERINVPACPASSVEAAISAAVREGSLWLLNGHASFQGEAVPAGLLTPRATLRAPLDPLPPQRLLPDAAPEIWKSGSATVLALSAALAGEEGHPIPWSVLRRAIDDAIASRWLEIAPESSAWPCDASAGEDVKLRTPIAPKVIDKTVPTVRTGTHSATASLEPNALQDLVDVLADIMTASAGSRLEFRLEVQLTAASSEEVPMETVGKINALLRDVNLDLQLR